MRSDREGLEDTRCDMKPETGIFSAGFTAQERQGGGESRHFSNKTGGRYRGAVTLQKVKHYTGRYYTSDTPELSKKQSMHLEKKRKYISQSQAYTHRTETSANSPATRAINYYCGFK